MSHATKTEPHSTDASIVTGRVLGGKYRVEEIIGSGGMGIVVSARHVTMNSRVAIKVVKLEEDADARDASARFLREARAAARIESDHVVRVIDVASLDDGTPYMVMELLDGEDFRQMLGKRGPLPIAEAVGYMLEACEGLAEAHAAGVVHRDLKPSNLFHARKQNGTKVVKVLDFGISKVTPRAGEVAITTTNALMGSPMYMAPEQMRSSRDVDSRADIWSLGLILYELLAGETAFSGDTIPEVCVAVMSGEPNPISRFRSDVPQELQAVLVKCLAKDRGDRHPTMAALARDLARFADERARVHADRASAVLKAARPTVETAPELDAIPSSSSSSEGAVPRTGFEAPTLPRDPETLKSWSGGRRGSRGQAGRRRATWIAAAVLASALTAVIGAKIAQGPAPPPATTHATIPPTSPVTPPPTSAPTPSPPPTPDVPSVPFDSLPLASPSRDAGVARAPRAVAPSARVSLPVPVPVPTPSSASSAPPAGQKDDWKWGGRN